MSRITRSWLSFGVVLLILVGVVILLPVVLIAYNFVPPVPHWPGYTRMEDLLRGRLSSADWRNIIVDVVWLGWFRFVVDTAISLYVEIRQRSARHIRYLGLSQSLVKELINSKAVIALGTAPGHRYLRLRGGVESPPMELSTRRELWEAERRGEGYPRRTAHFYRTKVVWNTYDPAALWWADSVGRHLVAANGTDIGKSVRVMRVNGDGVDIFVDRGTEVQGLFDTIDTVHGVFDWWAFDRTDQLAKRIVQDIPHPFPDSRIIPVGIDDNGGIVLVNLGWTGPLQIGEDEAQSLIRLSTVLSGTSEVPWIDSLAIVAIGCETTTPVDLSFSRTEELTAIESCRTSWMLIGGPVHVGDVMGQLLQLSSLKDRSLVVGLGSDPNISTVDRTGVLRVGNLAYDLGI